jgi:hypothetical protein
LAFDCIFADTDHWFSKKAVISAIACGERSAIPSAFRASPALSVCLIDRVLADRLFALTELLPPRAELEADGLIQWPKSSARYPPEGLKRADFV